MSLKFYFKTHQSIFHHTNLYLRSIIDNVLNSYGHSLPAMGKYFSDALFIIVDFIWILSNKILTLFQLKDTKM